MDEIYIGTEKTYPIEIQSYGFSMDAEFAETMQGYIQMMRGEQINVIDV